MLLWKKHTFFSDLLWCLFPTFYSTVFPSILEDGICKADTDEAPSTSSIAIVFGSESKQSIIKSSWSAYCQIAYEHFNYSPFPRGGVNGEKRRAAITKRKWTLLAQIGTKFIKRPDLLPELGSSQITYWSAIIWQGRSHLPLIHSCIVMQGFSTIQDWQANACQFFYVNDGVVLILHHHHFYT